MSDRAAFKSRLCWVVAGMVRDYMENDGFLEMVEETGIGWETAVALAGELAEEMARRGSRFSKSVCNPSSEPAVEPTRALEVEGGEG
jgi:hypothetical protein